MGNPSVARVEKRKAVVVGALGAGIALALAVLGALLTQEGAGGLNIFVETLSGRSGTLLGGASSVIPLGFAFGAGMVAAVNPCGFAMLPAYLGLFLGNQEASGPRPSTATQLGKAMLVGSTVCAGFFVFFGLAGALIGAGARPLVAVFPWLGLAVGTLLVLAGAWLLGGGRLYSGFAARASSRVGDPSEVGPRAYFLFGVAYGAGSLACTLPIFLAVVGVALTGGGLAAGVGQFILYALGMGLVVIVATLAVALFRGAMIGALRKAIPYVHPASAVLLLVAGSYIVFYWLSIGGLLRVG